jgi:hypothetical protein
MVSPFAKPGKISVAPQRNPLVNRKKATEIFFGFQIDVYNRIGGAEISGLKSSFMH